MPTVVYVNSSTAILTIGHSVIPDGGSTHQMSAHYLAQQGQETIIASINGPMIYDQNLHNESKSLSDLPHPFHAVEGFFLEPDTGFEMFLDFGFINIHPPSRQFCNIHTVDEAHWLLKVRQYESDLGTTRSLLQQLIGLPVGLTLPQQVVNYSGHVLTEDEIYARTCASQDQARIVFKVGAVSGLSFGLMTWYKHRSMDTTSRQSVMYQADFDRRGRMLFITNFPSSREPFCKPGDSGSLVFDLEGNAVSLISRHDTLQNTVTVPICHVQKAVPGLSIPFRCDHRITDGSRQ
ncbi:hypothetical protein RCL1_004321 [Eukaryota sp. TZLM3-RCL]